MLMALKDWRKAIRTPPSYRVGKNPKVQAQCVTAIAIISVIILYTIYRSSDDSDTKKKGYGVYDLDLINPRASGISPYNSTYPITKPLAAAHNGIIFRIGIVADMDTESASKLEANTWMTMYLKGTVVWHSATQSITVSLDRTGHKTLKSKYSYSGRGMELSELVTFDGRLFAVEDRSGIIYFIEDDKVYPWVLLTDGSGKNEKGFKSEWATVKDEHLYVGSIGKEWTTATGEFVNNNPMWVKRISRFGEVSHIPWRDNFLALRSAVGVSFPGYLIHESCIWSDFHRKWFFLPRRMSHESYNEKTDEEMGTNILLKADENFKNIEVITVGKVIPTRGFSSFKFIPGTRDEIIVALKTYELNGKLATYILAFSVDGKIIMDDQKVDDSKLEGFEFI